MLFDATIMLQTDIRWCHFFVLVVFIDSALMPKVIYLPLSIKLKTTITIVTINKNERNF